MDLVANKNANKVFQWCTEHYPLTHVQQTQLQELLGQSESHIEYPFTDDHLQTLLYFALHYLHRHKNTLVLLPTNRDVETWMRWTFKRLNHPGFKILFIDNKITYRGNMLQFMSIQTFGTKGIAYGRRWDLSILVNVPEITIAPYVFADHSVRMI